MMRFYPLCVGSLVVVYSVGSYAAPKKPTPPPAGTPAPAEAAPAEEPRSERAISLFGTSLKLGTILEQLSRNQGLHLIVRNDVVINKEVDIPTLQNTSFEDALRVILTPLGYSYEISGKDLIIFSRYVRVFRVAVPMIQQRWDSSVTNDTTTGGGNMGGGGGGGGSGAAGGGGGGGGGGTGAMGAMGGQASLGARIALTTQSSSEGLWNELEKSFATLLSKDGTFSVNRAAGLVTVNDKPYALDAVERYIEILNKEMSRQAVIEVRLAEVSLTDTLQAGIDWQAVTDAVGNFAVGSSGFSGSQLIKSPADAGAVTFAFSGVNGSVVLRALEQQGTVELVSQPALLVGNNLPALIQAGVVQTYVSAVSQTIVPNAGVQTSVETSLLSNGLIMSLLPRINEDGTVTMAVSVVLQEVVDIATRNFGTGTAVELPTFNRRSYSGVVTGKIGDTLAIAGLIDKKENNTSKGVPILSKIPVLGVFFGSKDNEYTKTELVILLTPKGTQAAIPNPKDLAKFPTTDD